MNRSQSIYRNSLCAAALLASLAAGCARPGSKGPKSYATPDEAVVAVVKAVRASDGARLKRILGDDGYDLLVTGDAVADQAERAAFLEAYDRSRGIEIDPEDGKATVFVGENDWPLPIPLSQTDGQWAFDIEAGREELLARRIGKNELAAIEVCKAIVDAQIEYAAMKKKAEGKAEFAKKIISDPGQKNGLYWEAKEGEEPSPLGPLIAKASAEGYATTKTAEEEGDLRETGYHGYHFRILTGQGEAAPGGARSYEEDGKLSKGFGLVAWPVKYGDTGVTTFLASFRGVVFQNDLGEKTAELAATMAAFDPGKQWDLAP